MHTQECNKLTAHVITYYHGEDEVSVFIDTQRLMKNHLL